VIYLNASVRLYLSKYTDARTYFTLIPDSRFPDSTARFIFAQIAQAVCLLHENNIVHRDLKDEVIWGMILICRI
jgi:serine/threonine protein kinase